MRTQVRLWDSAAARSHLFPLRGSRCRERSGTAFHDAPAPDLPQSGCGARCSPPNIDSLSCHFRRAQLPAPLYVNQLRERDAPHYSTTVLLVREFLTPLQRSRIIHLSSS
ncbi:hypothetical protein NDU88_001446 [Pleurodeles waltl]|uniref:Uncharacterized protein n=1 Tax=Pleurodeles waltl TaxID=8319 RepID=A0AAV7VBX2_PLEWA|nr:hypothetical protein NDU88_001446 [Pleurodeles waltl]